jgi:hypothetical protein
MSSKPLSLQIRNAAELKSAIDELLMPYWIVLRDRWNSSNGGWLGDNPDYIELFSDGSVIFRKKYNRSCRCHPEWHTTSLRLSPEQADMTILRFERALREMDRLYNREKQRKEGRKKVAAEKRQEEKNRTKLGLLLRRYGI